MSAVPCNNLACQNPLQMPPALNYPPERQSVICQIARQSFKSRHFVYPVTQQPTYYQPYYVPHPLYAPPSSFSYPNPYLASQAYASPNCYYPDFYPNSTCREQGRNIGQAQIYARNQNIANAYGIEVHPEQDQKKNWEGQANDDTHEVLSREAQVHTPATPALIPNRSQDQSNVRNKTSAAVVTILIAPQKKFEKVLEETQKKEAIAVFQSTKLKSVEAQEQQQLKISVNNVKPALLCDEGLYLLAAEYYSNGKHVEALRCIDSIFEKNTANAKHYIMKARIQYAISRHSNSDPKIAINTLDVAIRELQRNKNLRNLLIRALQLKATIDYNQFNCNEALQGNDQILAISSAISSTNFPVMYYRALINFEKGRYKEAKVDFEYISKINPSNGFFLSLRSSCYIKVIDCLESNNKDKIGRVLIQHLHDLINRNQCKDQPRLKTELYGLLALVYYSLKLYNDAEKCLVECLLPGTYPHHSGMILKAKILSLNNPIKMSIEHFNNLRARKGNYIGALERLADELSKEDRLEHALELYREILDFDKSPYFLMKCARIDFELGNFITARQMVSSILKLDPKLHTEVLPFRSLLHFSLGKVDLALADCDEALRLASNMELKILRVAIMFAMHMNKEAQSEIKELVSLPALQKSRLLEEFKKGVINPENERAKQNMGSNFKYIIEVFNRVLTSN